jgi:hypothetical protein
MAFSKLRFHLPPGEPWFVDHTCLDPVDRRDD